MLINFFDKYEINTENIEEKLNIISRYDTENASFINHSFKKTLKYLFDEEKLNNDNLICGIPKTIDKNIIIIFFDNCEKGIVNPEIVELSKIVNLIIIIGNHKNNEINDKIKLLNIKHVSKIRKIIRNNKIQIGFNANNIDNDIYYYGRMRNYYLNLLDKIDKTSEDDLRRDVEGTCTKLLLDEENFKSHHPKKENLIKMRNIIKTYDKVVNYYTNKKMINDKVFYINSKFNKQNICLLNSISELFWLYYSKDEKERFSYVYDVICERMLKEVKLLNYCNFKDNICITARYTDNSFPNSKENGCCNNTYKDKKKNCRYLKDDHSCSICSISCRVFTCEYLQKRGIDHSLWQYSLIDCVFSKLSRPNIIFGFFTPKEKMMKKIK